MAVSILIANWNGGEVIELCIESILKRTRYIPYEILVFDSSGIGSREREYLLKQKEAGRIKLITEEKRHQHGAGLRILIKNCSTKWICLLDSDVEVLSDDWLKILFAQIKTNNDLGVAKIEPAKVLIAPNGKDEVGSAPLFAPYCMLLNLPIYKEIMDPDDWEENLILPGKWIYENCWDVSPLKFVRILLDVGWKLTETIVKLGLGNRMHPTPPGFWKTKLKHYEAISHGTDHVYGKAAQDVKRKDIHEALINLRKEVNQDEEKRKGEPPKKLARCGPAKDRRVNNRLGT